MAEPRAQRKLWFAVLVPPAVWAMHGLLGWFISSHACPGTSQPWSYSAARWSVALITLVALAVTVAALVVAVRWVREPERSKDPERVRYLSMTGLVVGAALTLGLIYAGLPSLLIHGCGEMR
jgi:hypothetical protein